MQYVPWGITVAAVTYLFVTTDFSIVTKTLMDMPLVPFATIICIAVLVMYLIDVVTFRILFQRFYKMVSYRDLFLFKGASYILQIFHYYLSGTVMAGVVHLRHQFPLAQCFSGLIWIAMLDFVALSIWIGTGYFTSSGLGNENLDRWLLICTISIVVGFVFISVISRRSVTLMKKFRMTNLIFVLSQARIRDVLLLLSVRLAYLFVTIISNWLILPLFGIDIPLRELMLLMPVLVLVGSIPFTGISGLGTAQIVMRLVFAPYAANGNAQIDTFAVTTILALILVRTTVGLVSIPGISSELSQIEALSDNQTN